MVVSVADSQTACFPITHLVKGTVLGNVLNNDVRQLLLRGIGMGLQDLVALCLRSNGGDDFKPTVYCQSCIFEKDSSTITRALARCPAHGPQ